MVSKKVAQAETRTGSRARGPGPRELRVSLGFSENVQNPGKF